MSGAVRHQCELLGQRKRRSSEGRQELSPYAEGKESEHGNGNHMACEATKNERRSSCTRWLDVKGRYQGDGWVKQSRLCTHIPSFLPPYLLYEQLDVPQPHRCFTMNHSKVMVGLPSSSSSTPSPNFIYIGSHNMSRAAWGKVSITPRPCGLVLEGDPGLHPGYSILT